MPDYIQTTAEKWLADNGFSDCIISHPDAGDQYVQTVSDALKIFGKLVIEHTIETAKAHADYGCFDHEGALVNALHQFGLNK